MPTRPSKPMHATWYLDYKRWHAPTTPTSLRPNFTTVIYYVAGDSVAEPVPDPPPPNPEPDPGPPPDPPPSPAQVVAYLEGLRDVSPTSVSSSFNAVIGYLQGA